MFNHTRSTIVPAARRILLAACLFAMPAALVSAQEPASTPAPSQQQAPPSGGWQGGGRGAEMQQRQLDHLTKALNLTPDQVTQVKAIQDDGRQQMMALHQNTSLSEADRHSQMMSIHQAQTTKIEAILNPDQKTKFEAMQANREQHHQQQEQGQPAAPPSN